MAESKVDVAELKVHVLRLGCSMAGHLVVMAESNVDMAELKVHVLRLGCISLSHPDYKVLGVLFPHH
jgi:hypothetical protein